jgi:hypothetical protein
MTHVAVEQRRAELQLVYGLPSSSSHTWRRPNRSKWLIRKVEISTRPQPRANAPYSTPLAQGA